MARKFLTKLIPNENKEERALRPQLSLEKFKAEISLQKLRSQKHMERFQNLDAIMTAHFTMNYENDICNPLIELWETGYQKEEQKSYEVFNTKRDWYLNNTTTEFRNETAEEKNNKSELKQNNNNNQNKKNQSIQNQDRQNRPKQNRSRSSLRNRENEEGATNRIYGRIEISEVPCSIKTTTKKQTTRV